MAVTFEFTIDNGFHFAQAFGQKFEMPVADNLVSLPAWFGTGYIQEIALRQGLSLCLHRYRLNEQFLLRRMQSPGPSNMLALKFDCRKSGDEIRNYRYTPGCEAELGTGNFFTEISFPSNCEIHFLVININRELLADLLQPGEFDHVLKNRLLFSHSFVCNVPMSAEMEYALRQFAGIMVDTPFALLQYQSKAYHLIYLFFARLTDRVTIISRGINREDADKLYEVRTTILKDLSVPPHLPELSKKFAISPTKMKLLFRSIFGSTIYNYYQAARMNEAAKLLEYYSVSETGYRLGFTNLSHFSRQFEKYFKLKPKKFKDSKINS